MHLSIISFYAFLILNLQPLSCHPINTGLSDTDMDILNVLLQRLQDAVSTQTEVEEAVPQEHDALDREVVAKGEDGQQSDSKLDEAAIREFLSAKNLKSLRNDPARRTSSCFGRRMDRIGSMSSLGCNTVGRSSSK